MKKNFILLIILLIIIILIIFISSKISNNNSNHKIESYSYDPQKAVEFALKYSKDRNPDYPSFENNCVNFASQCLLAGGLKLDGEPKNSINKTKIKSTTNEWFCYKIDNDPYKPYSFYVSSSFIRYPDVVTYWHNVADIPYYTMENNMENKTKLRQEISVGDIIFLISSTYIHAAIVSNISDRDIYYSSNSSSRANYPLNLVDENEYTGISYLKFVQ